MDKTIRQYWRRVQRSLFPDSNEVFGDSPKHQAIIAVLDWLDLASLDFGEAWRGRPPIDRAALASAFVAKTILHLATTEALIDRLQVDRVLRRICAFDPCRRLPCKATFSNAFRDFAESELPDKIHAALIKSHFKGRQISNISRDSTDIQARGKLKSKAPWRRRKGKNRRLVRQQSMTLRQMLNDLPKDFDQGRKSHYTWKGYKLHMDITDRGIPISAVLTSASVHDSQVAIPLEELSSRRVKSLYSLMDSAYDAKEIDDFVRLKGKRAITAQQCRQDKRTYMWKRDKKRLKQRSVAERGFSRLKDHFGGRHIWVKGFSKVKTHLMFSVLVLTVEQLIRYH